MRAAVRYASPAEASSAGAALALPADAWTERTAPLRVVIVNDHLGYAHGVIHGPARWLRNVMPRFDPARVRAELLILGQDHPFAADLRRAGVAVHFLNRSKWDPRVALDLLHHLRAQRVEVLHVMGMKGAMLGPLVARAIGCRVIVNFRDANPLSPALRPLARAAVRRADVALSCSSAVARFAAKEFAVIPAQSVILHHGIPVEQFATPRPDARRTLRAEFAVGTDQKLVGVIGRLARGKGHDHLLRALARLRPRRPEVRLLIVGDGEQACALRQLVRALDLSEIVIFAGQRDDVAEILAALDVVAAPFLNEGLGLASLEAVAAGIPVIGFDAPGTNEAVVHGETGLLVPCAYEAALADALERVLGDPMLHERLAEACRAYRPCIGLEQHVRALEDIYLATVRGVLPTPPPTA